MDLDSVMFQGHNLTTLHLKIATFLRFKKFGNNWLQKRTIRRIKHLVGYPFHTTEKIKEDGLGYLLVDIEDYGLGNTRSRDDFMEFSQIKVDHTTGDLVCTKRLDWCVRGTVE